MKLWLFFLLIASHVHLGFIITKQKQTAFLFSLSWINVLASLVVTHFVYSDSAPLLRMLLLIYPTLVALKNVVTSAYYAQGSPLTYTQWLCFTLGWFGMRPNLFERLSFSNPDFRRNNPVLVKGISRVVVGALLVFVSFYLLPISLYYPRTLLILVGLSLFLHFGILNLQVWWWNSWGADCKELFKAPLKSKSLNEFWGKRWNMAFSEMTSLAVYRPIKKNYGVVAGIVAAFIFSGLLHEMAISLPVMNGFGLPLLYFALHGILMQMEERIVWIKSMLSNSIAAHFWVLYWLLLPMPLLFHKHFVNGMLNF